MPATAFALRPHVLRLRRAGRQSGARTIAQLGFWVGVAVVCFFLLAPTSIGGYDNYVLTDGTSMLPIIHGGGVVVIRQESNYHIGEIVAYHNKQLQNDIILHQIIAINDGHYTFKGVNNPQPDLYHPTKSELVGRKWLYWKNGGQFVANVKVPWVGALILGVLGMWAFADIGKADPSSRRRRRHHIT